jgi:hypothetical protein
MFGFGKDKKKENNAANLKLAKKLLKKDSGRRVFGFPCSSAIPAQVKILAGKLNVPIFALAEHELDLANGQIAKIVEQPEECEQLIRHIKESHIDIRTIEKISRYDQEIADRLDGERLKRFEEERAVRQIVINFTRNGLKPRELSWLIDYGMRCRIAVASGFPLPKNMSHKVSKSAER